MPKVCPLGAAQKILKVQSWRAANVYCQKVTCLAKKKNRDYVGKWKVPRVRCMTRCPLNLLLKKAVAYKLKRLHTIYPENLDFIQQSNEKQENTWVRMNGGRGMEKRMHLLHTNKKLLLTIKQSIQQSNEKQETHGYEWMGGGGSRKHAFLFSL